MSVELSTSKNCPSCGKLMEYSDKYKLKRSLEDNCVCRSCSSKNKFPNNETKQKMSDSHKGHACYKLRRGVKHSSLRKSRISRAMSGRTLSDIHKRNIAVRLTGRTLSPNHVHNLMKATEKSKYKRKAYKLGDKTVSIQGYENLALDKLVSELVPINQIKVNVSEKPRFQYEWNGNLHWYYPDCYLENSKTIVETKSDYTWKVDHERNLAKLRVAVEEGFRVRLLVWNGKKELVVDSIY